MEKYIKRQAEELILARLEAGFIVGLLGARQTGKTTLIKHLSGYFQNKGVLAEHIFSFNLDDVLLRNEIAADFYFIRNLIEQKLGRNLGNLSSPIILFIDEAQKAPDVFELVKIIHDDFGDKVKIILSGSASLEIQRKSAESLAGRISYVYLFPLSIGEILKDRFSLDKENGLFAGLAKGPVSLDSLQKIQAKIGGDFNRRREFELIFKTIILGGTLPAVWQKPKEKELVIKSLVETYLDKDIRSVKEVGDVEDFGRLVNTLAYETGKLLNIASLSRDLGIAVNTVKKYLSVLNASFVLNKLSPLLRRPRKRFVKSQKVYFFDVGLVNFLTKRLFWENLRGETAGFLFENLVIKSFEADNKNKPLPYDISFWRDYQGHEVDLVIEKEEAKIPVEITTSETLAKEKMRNLAYFFREFGQEENFGFVVYRGELKEIRIGKNKVFLLPWWLWW
ncbi:ATP-binding protein [Candidatus Shapirobacteria bacterium]|nr:ATP-binding protein [Candidatus Shapirobacteria bacterium]